MSIKMKCPCILLLLLKKYDDKNKTKTYLLLYSTVCKNL